MLSNLQYLDTTQTSGYSLCQRCNKNAATQPSVEPLTHCDLCWLEEWHDFLLRNHSIPDVGVSKKDACQMIHHFQLWASIDDLLPCATDNQKQNDYNTTVGPRQLLLTFKSEGDGYCKSQAAKRWSLAYTWACNEGQPVTHSSNARQWWLWPLQAPFPIQTSPQNECSISQAEKKWSVPAIWASNESQPFVHSGCARRWRRVPFLSSTNMRVYRRKRSRLRKRTPYL